MTTVAGTVKTIYIDPTGTPATSSGDSGNTHTKSSGLGTGPVVGIVIGVIGAVLIIAGGLLFWFFRRKREQRQVEGYQDDPSFRGSSGSNGPDMAGSGGAPASPNSAGNRSSMLQIDPRMDPFKQGLYARNGSHESVNTLRDEHDYSRRIHQPKVLRATNPDPENDE
jgi:cell wall integrity and stress response component